MKKYENNLTMGSTFVRIMAVEGSQPMMESNGILTTNEAAAVNAIMQVLRCLSLNRFIDQAFNPTVSDEDRAEMVKCRWERSGKLACIGLATKTFMHANSVEEAMQRNRIFTCTRAVYNQTPKRRQGKIK